MKKAKLILALVAVLGIAGGTLAFKAAKFGTLTYYTTNVAGAIAPTANAVPRAVTTATTTVTLKYWTLVPGAIAPAANYHRVLANI